MGTGKTGEFLDRRRLKIRGAAVSVLERWRTQHGGNRRPDPAGLYSVEVCVADPIPVNDAKDDGVGRRQEAGALPCGRESLRVHTVTSTYRNPMKMKYVLLFVTCAWLTVSGTAAGHGAVSMEQDICKLKVGSLQMHFAGYQPDSSRSEFCEDIPRIGRTVIVLDFIDDALRDLKTEVLIVRNPGSAADGKDEVVYRIP